MSTASSTPTYIQTDIPNGRLGVWVFLCGELVIFGGLLVAYSLLRLRHPEWVEYAAHTMWQIGAANTVVLLTSSLSMVLAFKAVDEERPAAAVKYLGATLILGLFFLGFKSFEYHHEWEAGLKPTTNLFWSFYYLMTGLHALHVIGGLVAITIVTIGVAKGKELQRVELVGLYWHLVDIVWIFLFPLLYIAS